MTKFKMQRLKQHSNHRACYCHASEVLLSRVESVISRKCMLQTSDAQDMSSRAHSTAYLRGVSSPSECTSLSVADELWTLELRLRAVDAVCENVEKEPRWLE